MNWNSRDTGEERIADERLLKCERLIGTLRRECLDWIIPLSEAQLRRTLTLWMPHYNRGRPHAALGPSIPEPRSELPARLQCSRHRLDRPASVVARPILNGVHHEYRAANAYCFSADYFCGPPSAVHTEKEEVEPMQGEQTPIWVQLIIPTLTAISGALAGIVVTHYQKARSDREMLESRDASNRLKYLDPLRLATENLAWRLFSIDQKISQKQPGSGGLDWMLHTFHCVKEPNEILHRSPSRQEFSFWCNGEGFFAISTIFITATYFFHARRTRREYTEDKELVKKLDAIRVAFGHEYGIYVLLQESIGEYMSSEDKMEIGFRVFCTKMYEEEERLWLLNLLDYFREIDKKTGTQRSAIYSAAKDLLLYLEQKTGMAVNVPSS